MTCHDQHSKGGELIGTSFISQQNISTLLQTLLTYSSLNTKLDFQRRCSCVWFIVPPIKRAHLERAPVVGLAGVLKWRQETPVESSRFAAACRSRPCGCRPREVFRCPEIAFSLVRKEFSEGQPSGSTAWRFVRL